MLCYASTLFLTLAPRYRDVPHKIVGLPLEGAGYTVEHLNSIFPDPSDAEDIAEAFQYLGLADGGGGFNLKPLDMPVVHEFGDLNPDLVRVDPSTGRQSCPFGLVLVRGNDSDGGGGGAAGCRARPRIDYELHYAKGGGMLNRVEPLPVLYSRLQTFRLELSAAELESAGAAAAAAAAASYTEHGQAEQAGSGSSPKVAALSKLNRLLQANSLAAAASAQSKGNTPVPLSLVLEVVLPGMEQSAQTVAPVFDGVGEKDAAEWLRVAMRHSKEFEGSRHRTVIAPTWWGAAAEETSNITFFSYNDGPEGRPRRIGVEKNAGVVLDGQTVLHGTTSYGGGDADLPAEWAALRCAAEGDGSSQSQLRLVYDGGADAWNVVRDAVERAASGTATATAMSVPAAQVLLKATWVASVEDADGLARHAEYNAAKARKTVKTARYIVDRLVAPLRTEGLFGYREHLLESDEARIRTKLAKFLTEQYVFFPRGVYTNWNWYIFLEWLPLDWLPKNFAHTIRAPFVNGCQPEQ